MSDIPYLDGLRDELLAAARRSRSRTRKRRLVILSIAAAVGLLVVGGVGASDLRWPLPDDVPPGTEPVQHGHTASVTTGAINNEGWVLTARNTDQGLCVGVQYGRGWDEGCGFPTVDNQPVQLQISGSENVTFLYGHVRADVERVTIHLENGSSVAEPTLQEEGYAVRFYVHAFEGRTDVERVVGYNSEGEAVGRAQ